MARSSEAAFFSLSRMTRSSVRLEMLPHEVLVYPQPGYAEGERKEQLLRKGIEKLLSGNCFYIPDLIGVTGREPIESLEKQYVINQEEESAALSLVREVRLASDTDVGRID